MFQFLLLAGLDVTSIVESGVLPWLMVQWFEHQHQHKHKRVAGLIPGQECVPGFQVHSPALVGLVWEASSQCAVLTSMFLSPLHPPFHSL